jgi:hypothetical protein
VNDEDAIVAEVGLGVRSGGRWGAVRLPLAAVAAAVLAVALTGCGGIGPTAAPSTVTVTETVSAGSGNSGTREWTMPNEIGKDLQTAQDDLQALTGNPAYVSTSKDLAGSRHQINDRNWKVCSSTPAAGETFTQRTNVQFGVVKNDESCP